MVIYHCSIQIISRSAGRSAVAAASYRSGSRMYEAETGIIHDFTRKMEVVYSEIDLPPQAPAEYSDRETLWNAVHAVEKNKNAQLAREIEVALPVEFSKERQVEVLRDYVQTNFVDKGMCADWSIHDKGTGNPHAHIMLTMRPISENGKWAPKERKEYALDKNGERIPLIDKKTGEQKLGKRNEKLWKRATVQTNDWNDKNKAEEWRKSWADTCNRYLEPEMQIDHRSYKRQHLEKSRRYTKDTGQGKWSSKGFRLTDANITARSFHLTIRGKSGGDFWKNYRKAFWRKVVNCLEELTNELEDMMNILKNQERLLAIIEEQQTEIDSLKHRNEELMKQRNG